MTGRKALNTTYKKLLLAFTRYYLATNGESTLGEVCNFMKRNRKVIGLGNTIVNPNRIAKISKYEPRIKKVLNKKEPQLWYYDKGKKGRNK